MAINTIKRTDFIGGGQEVYAQGFPQPAGINWTINYAFL
jgi:hypothetical protein